MVLSLLKSMVTSSRSSATAEAEHTQKGQGAPRVFDFHGGIHPPEHKALSNRAPLVAAPLPREVVLPLSQHIGAPAQPLVQIGQRVKTGELIARAQGMISAPVHASITGVVTAIEPRQIPHVSGLEDQCIVIERDGEIDEWARLEAWRDWRQQEAQDLIQRLQDAGVVGQGGAGFPSAVKARVRERHAIDTLILNAAECEPYITADDLTMRTHPEALIEGLEILASLIGPECILIGIEDNKPEAVIALEQAIRARRADKRLPPLDSRLEVVVVPTKYPSGGEKQLIKLLTDREVPSRGLPADVGVVVHNPGTVRAVQRAVCFGEPMISRIVTLTGEALQHPHNVEARLGTSIADLLRLAAPAPTGIARLVMGGPMMGFTLESDALPIIKTTNCLLASSPESLPAPAVEQPCIRCGMCEQACPAELLPQQLYWFSKAREFDKAELYNLADCIECGACSYVCPSQIPLVQYYRFAKGEIRSAQHEARKSERARHRFEFKQARMAREEAEKEAKRQQRAQAAQKSAAARADASAAADTTSASAAPATTTAAAAQPAPATDIKAFKTARAAANIALKKAEKALKAAQDGGESSESDIAKLEANVTAAKAKLASAESALKAASEASESAAPAAAGASTASTSTTGVAAPAADLKALKTARAAANIAVKKAEKALKTALDSGEGDIPALETSVAEAKTRLAKAEADLKAASESAAPAASSTSATGAAAPAADLKALKTARAAANIAVKKAEKALKTAQDSGEGDISALEASVTDAKSRLAKAEGDLKAVTDAAGAATSPVTTPDASAAAGSSAYAAAPAAAAPSADIKALKTARAAANIAVKKAEKALARASESGEGDIEDLQTLLATAQENLRAAEVRLNSAQAGSTDATPAAKGTGELIPEAPKPAASSVGRGSMASNVTLSQAEIEASRAENLAKRHKQVSIAVKAAEAAHRKAEAALSEADDENRQRLATKVDRTRRNLEHARESLAEVQALVDAQ
ncbi:MAG: electron transport complex subunit RsxC [Cobetia sp.]|uniref:electron transport complex subunit RsxC n=2 Tax=Cobetia sp. TaxID=1873876 RepID=UPI000C53DD32|nr:electron transport complex subunit RsxC [Cobetia sp.]MBK10343.1 electron transport complex subunit RsxC [Cobetia sp.]HAR08728.1 electron transport complex subunit RsxC [Cobetia sp.]|tara:strand:- start:29005 stop:31986 length:2982 start_codon:yes stop_codon:yes gene_type:complete